VLQNLIQAAIASFEAIWRAADADYLNAGVSASKYLPR
jgi:hypothetical protein